MRDCCGINRDPASIPHNSAADPAALLNPIPLRSPVTCPAVAKRAGQQEAAEEAPRLLLLRPPPVQALDRRLDTHLDKRWLAFGQPWPPVWTGVGLHAARMHPALEISLTHPASRADPANFPREMRGDAP